MTMDYPTRSESHQLEELAERFFRSVLPRNWTCEKPGHDYGVDLRVDLFDGEAATGLEFLVQLKASAQAADGEAEVLRLKTTTYNLLRAKLSLVMVVKFVEAENEGYYLLLRDVVVPSAEHDTFSVSIPKSNRLSNVNWSTIQEHVREVTDRKLAAARKKQVLQRRRI